MFLRKVFYSLSTSARRVARKLFYFPIDCLESLSLKKDPLVPPKGLIFTGSGDFAKSGDKVFKNIEENCPINPSIRILDIGCGIGRIARPFTRYLQQTGSYEGFDVVEDGVKWCNEKYKNFKNFKFKYIPLKNDLYNLESKTEASSIKFSYASNDFDLVILNSVFTHMQIKEVENYLSEIARVLKKGGTCYCTFFLITQEIDQLLEKSDNPFFKYKYENYYLHHPTVKDANIAFQYDFINGVLIKHGLKIEKYFKGWWSDENTRPDSMDFQDILIIRK